MSQAVDLVANMQVRAVGVPQAVAEVNRAFRGAGGTVRVEADSSSLNTVNSQLATLHNNMRTAAVVSSQAAASVGNFGAQAAAANGGVRTLGSAAGSSASQVKGLGVAAKDAADFMGVLGAQAGLSVRRLLAFSEAAFARTMDSSYWVASSVEVSGPES